MRLSDSGDEARPVQQGRGSGAGRGGAGQPSLGAAGTAPPGRELWATPEERYPGNVVAQHSPPWEFPPQSNREGTGPPAPTAGALASSEWQEEVADMRPGTPGGPRGCCGHIRKDAHESLHSHSCPLVRPVGPVPLVDDYPLPPPPSRKSPKGAGAERQGAGLPLKGPRPLPVGHFLGTETSAPCRDIRGRRRRRPSPETPGCFYQSPRTLPAQAECTLRPAAETARVVIHSHPLRVDLLGLVPGAWPGLSLTPGALCGLAYGDSYLETQKLDPSKNRASAHHRHLLVEFRNPTV